MIPTVNSKRPLWLKDWLQRHQNPVSRGLHCLGIPLTIAAVVLAGVQLHYWRWDLWWRPAVLLIVGYLLQLIGHLLEGNDIGEIIIVKKLLGRAYVAISPRYADRGDGSSPRGN